MYVRIKYKMDGLPKDKAALKYSIEELKKTKENSNFVDGAFYDEDFLRFDTTNELDYHIEGTIKFIRDVLEMNVIDIQIEDIPVDEYLERLSFNLKHAIVQRYAASIDYEFKSIRDENKHCRDKDFLIKAYEYALDFLEVKDSPFKKFENDSSELS